MIKIICDRCKCEVSIDKAHFYSQRCWDAEPDYGCHCPQCHEEWLAEVDANLAKDPLYYIEDGNGNPGTIDFMRYAELVNMFG